MREIDRDGRRAAKLAEHGSDGLGGDAAIDDPSAAPHEQLSEYSRVAAGQHGPLVHPAAVPADSRDAEGGAARLSDLHRVQRVVRPADSRAIGGRAHSRFGAPARTSLRVGDR